MKNYLRTLFIMAMLLPALSSPLYAGWRDQLAANERKAAEYISQLKNGRDPDSIQRPILQRINQAKSRQEKKRLTQAMDEAEVFAKEGRQNEIKELEIYHPPIRP